MPDQPANDTDALDAMASLTAALHDLVRVATEVDAALDTGHLNRPGVETLEYLYPTLINQSAHWLITPPPAPTSQPGSPSNAGAEPQEPLPEQAHFLHGNLIDLRIIPKNLIDAIGTGQVEPATVAELAIVYHDTITSLRWLMIHHDTSAAQELLRDLTISQYRRAKA